MAEELEVKEQEVEATPEVEKKGGKDFKKSRPDFKKKKFSKERVENEFDKRTIAVRRVTKVVKGGKKMHFSVTMIVGDKKGKIGIGSGKAADVTMANDKAFQNAKKHLVTIALDGSTIPHEVWGKFGKSSVLLMPAPEGTGVDAGGPVRAMADLAGIKNIVSKSYGSRNKINVIYATLNGFLSLRTREQVAALRGKAVDEI